MQAAQNVLVEHWHNDPEGKQKLRAMNMYDLISAAETVRPGVTRAQEYGVANLRSSSSHFDQPPFGNGGSNGGSNAAGMAQLMAAAAAAAAAQRSSSAGGSKTSPTAAGAANGAAAAAAESAEAAAQDEVYKMVGKMVLNSLSFQ
jgi:hypothetical protein